MTLAEWISAHPGTGLRRIVWGRWWLFALVDHRGAIISSWPSLTQE